MPQDLAKTAERDGIRYFLITFVDLFGVLRAKLVPAAAIAQMQRDGAAFAGFATHLDVSPADPDVFAIPDPNSLMRLPWQPEVGWLAADPHMGGRPIAHAPRNVLKRQIAAAERQGYRMKTGVEAEFFIVRRDGSAIADEADAQTKPCYDQAALMRRYDLIRAIGDAMQGLGWGPYQNDHEDANGQFEMNWTYDDSLVTADRHVFFKMMVKTLAEREGLRATFMPKPFMHLTGSGCHAHVSLWDKAGADNLFFDGAGELGLSSLAYTFLGGIIAHAEALTALFTPTVNSFKRINAPVTTSGATWSPNAISYGGNNRTHMVRIPEPGRFELRLMDGAANPYLMQAGVLASGLDGIARKSDPGQRLDINMYTEGHTLREVRRLPLNLLDALRALDGSTALRELLGADFVDAYLKLRMAEWHDYTRHLTQWERDRTLDC
ncbi:MAG: type III glutamate--ammonia ligase [Alphaproteobacteria bacterium]|nr:type III glutamate--ammonia ligase [Alphaproteobacteria bacterium]